MIRLFHQDEYRLLRNIYLNSPLGLTQIDYILISSKGIFVIEMKDLKGWLFGSKYDKYWTQSIFRKKYQVYNPIHQNYGHVQVLKEKIPQHSELIQSVIVLTGRSEFKSSIPESVVYMRDFQKYYIKFPDVVSDDHRLNEITFEILSKNENNLRNRLNHFRQVKFKQEA